MKNRLTSHLGFVAMAFLLATAVTVTADLADMTKAKVVRIKGSARVTTGTGAWQPLKVGDVLTSGAVIQTAADSRVDLVLGDPKAVATNVKVGLPFGSAGPGGGGGGAPGASSAVTQNFLRLMENTVMSIDKLAATDTGADVVTDTQLDLRSGRIFGTVKKLSAGSRYDIKIPNGVAGVRGTIYMLSALGDCMVREGAMGMGLTLSDGSVIKRIVKAMSKYNAREDVLTDMTKQDLGDMNANTYGSQGNAQGSDPWGATPVISKDKPYLEPTEGYISPTQQ